MNYRLSTIMRQKSYTSDTTETIDLDMADPISQLIIELAVTNVGDTATAHAIACLNKIEIVDGSDVLFSLSGYEAEAMDIYHNKGMRSNWNPYLTGMGCQRFIGINFGRFLWDPLLAFDPKKFRNPQLKLSLSIAAGGNAATPCKLQVWAALFDQKAITPVGFLMHKEVKDYTMGASAHEYTDLPRDYPYRKLMIRNLEAGTEPNQNIGNVKLSEDQDRRVVFDQGSGDLLRVIASQNPMLTELIMCPVTTSQTYGFCTPTTRTIGNISEWAEAIAAGAMAFYDGDGGRFKKICATGPTNCQVVVSGWLPHGVLEIPFGDQLDMEDWYKVNEGIGNLKLDITGASGLAGTETCQVFLQQLRKYAAGA